ncbi:MAG TPA: radical SAM protein, partial [Edaphobacter sp.]|nr:radical SAM protein [Edaphobacter sp.]
MQSAASLPQLGILSVAAVLERCGDIPHLIDANTAYMEYANIPGALHADTFAEYLAEIAVRSNADLYGFSSICSTYPLTVRVARAVKNLRPHAMILFGGPQASVVDEATLAAFPWIDFILRGEVEQSLPCLFQELHRDYDFSQVRGLTYRDGTAVRRNPNAPVIEDLDALPPPAYHLSKYLTKATAASIELGRGCPFSCTFCSTNDFFRRNFRLRSPARVLKEMREIAEVYGIRHFDLVHDMFTVDRKRVVAFCGAMLASDEGFTWDCSARTDCVDRELLELMARSGCRSIFFGVETGSQKMQRVIDKDLDLDIAKEMLNIAEQLGVKTTVALITGFPEEDWEDVRETLRIFT